MNQKYRGMIVAVVIACLGMVMITSAWAATSVTVLSPDGWTAANVRADGNVAITGAQPRSGNGSLEFTTNTVTAGQDKADYIKYWGVTPGRTLGNLQALSYEFYRASSSTAAAHYAPAFRLAYKTAANETGYLIWEPAYNGYGSITTNSWISANILSGNFWMRAFNPGQTFEDYDITLAEWIANQDNGAAINAPHVLGADTAVIGIEVGVGSGWGNSFKGFVDNVLARFGQQDEITANFELPPGSAANQSVLVYKFNDANGNQQQDPGENGLNEWEFTVYDANWAAVATGVTGQVNDYEVIFDLPGGSYFICETLQAGWENTLPGTTPPCLPVTIDATGNSGPGPSVATITLNDNRNSTFRITFVSKVDNTWTYQVEEVGGRSPSGRDLSHWSLGIDTCINDADDNNLTASTPAGAEIGADGSTGGFVGIKWNVDSSFSSGLFSFTLDGDYPLGTVNAMVKAGTANATGAILGPICQARDPQTVKFANRELPGTLTVNKTVNWNGAPQNANQLFEICVTPNATPTCQTVEFNGGEVSWVLPPGDYTVSETNPGPWTTTINGNPGQAASVTLTAGETTTVNIVNTRLLSAIKAIKFNDLDADGEHDGNEPGLPNWSINFKNGGLFGVTGANGEVSLAAPEGQYELCEVLQDGWQNSTPLCQSITLGVNEVQTVQFGNYQPGSLTITKVTEPAGSPESFSFDGGSGLGTFSLTDGGSKTFANLIPANYTVTEAAATGWQLPSVACVNAQQEPVDTVTYLDYGVTAPVAPGEHLTCIFTNTEEPEPQVGNLTVSKRVEWGDLAPDESLSFQICVIGSDLPDGKVCEPNLKDGDSFLVEGLPAGNVYTVVETDPGSEWTVTNNNVLVTIQTGDNAVEVVNTYNPQTPVCPPVTLASRPNTRVWQDGDRTDSITLSPTNLFPVYYAIEGFYTNPNAPAFDRNGESGILTADNPTLTFTYPASWGDPNASGAREVHVVVHLWNECGYKGLDWDRWYHGGRLTVEKLVDWNGSEPTGELFTICITGPQYPAGDCQSLAADSSYTWEDLVPGVYTVSEQNLGAGWQTPVYSAASVNVPPLWSDTGVTITNTHDPVCEVPVLAARPQTRVWWPDGDSTDQVMVAGGFPVNYAIEGFYTNPNAPGFDRNGESGVLTEDNPSLTFSYPPIGQWGDPNASGAHEVHVVVHLWNECGYVGMDWDRWYHDTDSDGAPNDVDCAYNDPGVYPGAPEIAGDGIDQDCDGADLPLPPEEVTTEVMPVEEPVEPPPDPNPADGG